MLVLILKSSILAVQLSSKLTKRWHLSALACIWFSLNQFNRELVNFSKVLICNHKKTVLCDKVSTESTLPFESIWLKYLYIWSYRHLSYIFDKLGMMLTGRSFSTLFRSSFLKTGITSAFFNSEGKVVSNIELLKLWRINSENINVIFNYFHRYITFLTSIFYLDYRSYFLYQN